MGMLMGTGMTSGAQMERPIGDVRAAINELKSEVKDLDVTLSRLYERIAPICSAVDGVGNANQPCSPSSTAIGGELRVISSDVLRMKLLVTLIIDKVGV